MNHQKLLAIKKIQQRKKNSGIKSCFLFDDDKKIGDINQVIKKLPKKSNIIFRHYHLDNNQREIIAYQYLALAKKFKHSLIIGKNLDLAIKISSHGIHFSDFDFKKNFLKILIARNFFFKKKLFFSLAIHDLKSLNFCKIISPDTLFFSPVFSSTTHKNSKSIGFYNFIKFRKIISDKCRINNEVIAPLGGINLQNLQRLNNIKITKFGAIDFFNNL